MPETVDLPLHDGGNPDSGRADSRRDPLSLDQRISSAQAKHARGLSPAEGRAETRGWAVGIEFVGTVLVSTFIGWAIDHWAPWHTAPWAMIVLLVLGFAAGVRRAIQTSKQFEAD